jgi:hypothetical protein
MKDKTEASIPSPSDPVHRAERLPRQEVKSHKDDPEAFQRVEELLHSDTYRRADLDIGFLDNDDLRGVRLQLDYTKPELHLRDHGIEETIVVFGGTRIVEHGVAKRNLEELKFALEHNPDDPALPERIRIAERILAKSVYYEIAREFGTIVGRSGTGPDDCRVTLMTGAGRYACCRRPDRTCVARCSPATYSPLPSELLKLTDPEIEGWLVIVPKSLIPLFLGPLVRHVAEHKPDDTQG